MSRRLKADLFMGAMVVALGAFLYYRYRPEGYRYDFTIATTLTTPGATPTDLMWTGYGLERRQEVMNFGFNDGALELTRVDSVPAIDTTGGFTSLRRTNKHSWEGPGGKVAGHETKIFRYVDHDTLFVTDSGGRRLAHANRVVTDYYIEEGVGEIGRRFSRMADSINLRLSGLAPHQVRERVRGREERYKGVPLRIVSRVSWVDGNGRTGETTTRSEVSALGPARVSSHEIEEMEERRRATLHHARRNGLEYSFRITTQDSKGQTGDTISGEAQAVGEQVRVMIEGGENRDRDRRGEYMVISDHGKHVAVVRPRKREYAVVTADSLARLVSVGLNAVSRFVDVKLGGLEASASKLGPGEEIAGYATEKYRMTQQYRLQMKVFGAQPTLTGRLTTDFWISPQLAVPSNPFFDFFALLPSALALQSPDYVRQSLAERAKMFETLPLRTVATLEMTDADGKVTRSISTIEVTPVQRSAIDPTRFEIPSSYKTKGGAEFSF
jgi:hypothetical protein